jgi:hypothetical protein
MTENANHETKNPPVHSVRFGAIRCAVWANETKNGVMHSTVLTRTYRDENGEYQETNSLRRDDLLLVGKVLDMAHTWICQTEQERHQSQD